MIEIETGKTVGVLPHVLGFLGATELMCITSLGTSEPSWATFPLPSAWRVRQGRLLTVSEERES